MYLRGLAACTPDTVLNMPNDGRQFTSRNNRSTCEGRGGLFSEGGCWIKDNGVCTSWLPDKCVYRGACAAPASNTTTITTQVSPQISPNLIQQQQPTNSPVGASTSQTGAGSGGDYQVLLEQMRAQQEEAAQRALEFQNAISRQRDEMLAMRNQAPQVISMPAPMPIGPAQVPQTTTGTVDTGGVNPMMYAAGAAFALAAFFAINGRHRRK